MLSRMSACLHQDRLVSLGSTPEFLFPVGQGTNGFGSRVLHDPIAVRARQEAIVAGIEQGITLLDTAELYGGGFAEECLAPILTDHRDEVFLATKFSSKTANTAAEIQRSVEGSLRRLGTDRVDLLQVHYPNPAIADEVLFSSMLAAVQSGKARYLGVSNFSVKEVARAKTVLGDHLASIQVEYNPYDRTVEWDLLPWAAANAVTVLAYSPLGHGKLALSSEAETAMAPLMQRYGCTLHQLVLTWVLRHPHVVALTKTACLAHQANNVAAARLSLEPAEMAALDRALDFPRTDCLPTQITPDSGRNRPTYRTLEEAVRNDLQLVPSPADLATLLRAGHQPKPIRLQPAAGPTGAHLLQPFDHYGELRKYWAWIMVHGWSTPMPALVAS
jgi:aryl-alcohol dehydrogenase-like predicted oxidoreductase